MVEIPGGTDPPEGLPEGTALLKRQGARGPVSLTSINRKRPASCIPFRIGTTPGRKNAD